MPGTLFVVATPIGNLEDLTFRALRILKTCDLIAAEDTRRTSKLLSHYGISTPMVSLRAHNERRETPRLVERLASGTSIALVTDAGTPGISDPGAGLVRGAREAGVTVVPIPGPSAVTAALSATGFEGPEFVFLGFAPHGRNDRVTWFQALAEEARAVVFFEAPHRIVDAFGHLRQLSPPRGVAVFCELTKVHERVIASTTDRLDSTALNPQGEFVLVLGPAHESHVEENDRIRAVDMFGRLTAGTPLGHDVAVRAAAYLLGMRESLVNNAVRKSLILAKRQNMPSS